MATEVRRDDYLRAAVNLVRAAADLDATRRQALERLAGRYLGQAMEGGLPAAPSAYVGWQTQPLRAVSG
jgi:hypothetical protein